jgi:hypothetical protein
MIYLNVIIKIINKLLKIIKYLLMSMFLIVFVLIILDILIIHFSPNGIKGKRNIRNGLLINEGMTVKEVIRKMGYPLDVKLDTTDGNVETTFNYIVPPNTNSQCRIYFDNKNRVIATQVYDE